MAYICSKEGIKRSEQLGKSEQVVFYMIEVGLTTGILTLNYLQQVKT